MKMSQSSLNPPIQDVIHGEISNLPDEAHIIIATQQFRRLLNVQQLGSSSFFFSSATHKRYHHCIGTAYLCAFLLDKIEENSDVKIFEEIVDYELKKKCVILAALSHDIGHGSFSHLWEQVVHLSDSSWTHEEQSQKMIEFMMKDNEIQLHDDDEKHKFAVELISSLVKGDVEKWREILTPNEMFLTEIVSNKYCEIDVDKCDYILRDQHHLNENVKVKKFKDFLNRAKVVFDQEGVSHVGYHADDFELIENLFSNRAHLHCNVYQCDEVLSCEKMVKDILILASTGGIKINELPLTLVHSDDSAFLQLDDSVLEMIRHSSLDNEQIRKAKEIIEDLMNGRLYRKIYEADDEDIETLEKWKSIFGDAICEVWMKIPKANVPENIPLYNNDGELVTKLSKLNLAKKSWMIFVDDKNFEKYEKNKIFDVKKIDTNNNSNKKLLVSM